MNNNNRKIPLFFDKLLKSQYCDEEIEKIIDGLSKKRVVSLRVNTIKTNILFVKENLKTNNIIFEEINYIPNALIIKNTTEYEIKKLDIYEKGFIYLQSLSSILPPLFFDCRKNMAILDMAAAPGGKTCEIAALNNNFVQITACEINPIRIEKLKYNIQKQGVTSCTILKQDARFLDDFFSFDGILLDAPCSGSGTINLNEDNIEKKFNDKLLNKCVQFQKALLKKAINILKPGSELIYSTCSILKNENENIILEALKTNRVEVLPIDLDPSINTLSSSIAGTKIILPNEYFEGFFIAKLRKIK